MECLVISRRFHRGFTAAEKTALWDRWQRGESLKAIGRAFSESLSSVYLQLSLAWWDSSAPRRRSKLALTYSELEEIFRGIAAAQSARSMARLLGRSPSTVSRELSRNRPARSGRLFLLELSGDRGDRSTAGQSAGAKAHAACNRRDGKQDSTDHLGDYGAWRDLSCRPPAGTGRITITIHD